MSGSLDEEIKELIKALGSKDKDVRWKASEELARLGEEVVRPLIEALERGRDEVRVGAAITLGKIEGVNPEHLIKVLTDKNWEVRWAAATSLGNMKAREAIDVLVKLLKDESWDVRRAAAIALGKIKDPKAVEPLIETLKSELLIRFEAARSLIQIGYEAVPELISVLKADNVDIDVKVKAAEALGLIGDERAVESLVKLLNDPNGSVRDAASKALVKIGGRAIDELITFLRSGNYKLEILKALEANLDKEHLEKLFEVLIGLLNDEDEEMRYEAVMLMGKMGDRGIEHLIKALDDESEFVKRGARISLILNGKASLPYLERELKSHTLDIEKTRLIQEIIDKIKAI